ncbi:endonuclease domain-containing protein [Sorangium sp. So ce118]
MKQIETSDKVLEFALKILFCENADFAVAHTRCESPIEQLFLACVMRPSHFTKGLTFGSAAVDAASNRRGHGSDSDEIDDNDVIAAINAGWAVFVLLQQPTIKCAGHELRPDFALAVLRASANGSPSPILARVAIELDGHDWHERTKEQAAADRQRDRRMAVMGWTVVRYTGSEVYQDPAECFWSAIEISAKMASICENVAELVHDAGGRNTEREVPRLTSGEVIVHEAH